MGIDPRLGYMKSITSMRIFGMGDPPKSIAVVLLCSLIRKGQSVLC